MSDKKLDKTTILKPDGDDLKSIIQTFVQETTLITADDAAIAGKQETLPGIKGQRYEVGEILGAGGMGVVLQAFDKNLQRSVAMKVLQRARVTDGSHALRFIREAEITGGLEHPNIIPLHEMGLDRGSNAYYTMKQVKGETLKHILKQLKANDPDYVVAYPFQRLIEIFLKVCNAISLAHDRGVIHRDLKPENVMVGDYGEVLVIDWGLARRENDAEPEAPEEDDDQNSLDFVTQAGAVMGTPGFMSPEQARGRGVGPLSDVFSLGAILFNILTFRPPVTGRNLREVLINLLKGELESPEEVWRSRRDNAEPVHLPGGSVPTGLSAVAMKALAIRPDNRYPSVSELQQDVESFQAGFATGAEQASLLRQIFLMMRRYKKSVGVISAIVAGIILYGGLFTMQLNEDIARAEEEERTARELIATADKKREDAQAVYEALRSKAPTLERQAKYKLERHQTSDALDLIEQAIFLDDDNGEYYQLKGDILQNRFAFYEAREAYKKAIAHSGSAPGLIDKKEASMKFAEMPEEEFLELLLEFNKHLLDHGRHQESLNTLRQLWRKRGPYLKTGKELVKSKDWDAELSEKEDLLYGHTAAGYGRQKAICLQIRKCDPYFDFREIQGMGIKDLRISGATFLTGWEALVAQHNLYKLEINGAKSVDLAKLKGLKIRDLDLYVGSLENIEVLNDMGLLYLALKGEGLTDETLSGLRGPDIQKLGIHLASITHLDFLEHFPVAKDVFIIGSPVSDISVLGRIPTRQFASLELDRTKVDSLIPLKNHTIVYFSCEYTPITSFEGLNTERLARLSARSTKVNNLEHLGKTPCEKLNSIDLRECPIRDITPLMNAPKLSTVDISSTSVSDLTPLKNARLLKLFAIKTAVRDIAPIRLDNLQELSVDIEELTPASIGALRNAPRLRMINGVPVKNFWKRYDSKVKAVREE